MRVPKNARRTEVRAFGRCGHDANQLSSLVFSRSKLDCFRRLRAPRLFEMEGLGDGEPLNFLVFFLFLAAPFAPSSFLFPYISFAFAFFFTRFWFSDPSFLFLLSFLSCSGLVAGRRSSRTGLVPSFRSSQAARARCRVSRDEAMA